MRGLFDVAGPQQDCVLVASCLGESTGGGLVSFDGEQVDIIDRISSTGIALADGCFLRLLWCRGDFLAPGELLVSDYLGIERYLRIDEVNDPHDILFDGENYVIASAGGNSILWIATSGTLVRQHQLPGEPDSWHLNSLLLHEGDLYVAAFGRFKHYREWNQHAGEGRGIIFNLRTGQDVLTGLEMPHHPRILDDSWIVCNSATHQLVQFDFKTRKITRQVQLQNWTRGLTASNKYIFVGESARRYRPGGGVGDALASIAVLERDSWRLVSRIALPFEEVYDLVLVPAPLLDGIRRGFRTNPQRIHEENQHRLFADLGITPVHIWASGDLLPKEACLGRVSLSLGEQLEAGCVVQSPCVVTNSGTCIFVSAKPHPVFIAYRWFSKKTRSYVRHTPLATRLPSSVPPGASLPCKVRFRTPLIEGLYDLEVSLYQKGRGFFADIHPGNIARFSVQIVKSAAQ